MRWIWLLSQFTKDENSTKWGRRMAFQEKGTDSKSLVAWAGSAALSGKPVYSPTWLQQQAGRRVVNGGGAGRGLVGKCRASSQQPRNMLTKAGGSVLVWLPASPFCLISPLALGPHSAGQGKFSQVGGDQALH